jgi:membrane protein DedA with SNARE-associated domain
VPVEQWLEAIPPLLVYVIVGLVIGFESLGIPRLFAWMGRKFPKRFGETQLSHARRVFQKRGAWAVFFGRFVALLRILAGPLAGSMHMSYGKFLLANASGGIVWAGGTTAAVHYLGVVAEKRLKGFSYAGLAIAVVFSVAGVFIVKKRLAKAAEKEVTPA